MKTTRVVVAEHDDLVATGLRVVLESEDDIEVVGLAGNGQALLDYVRVHKPDVVVLDVTLPVLDGVAATRCVHTLYPACQILLLITNLHAHKVIEGIQAGARGFLLKTSARTDLIAAVRTVARCEPFVHTTILAMLLDTVCWVTLPATPSTSPMILSAREREVLQLVAAGLANANIAERLGITVATVKRHLSTIFHKLAVTSRHEAVAVAREQRIV